MTLMGNCPHIGNGAKSVTATEVIMRNNVIKVSAQLRNRSSWVYTFVAKMSSFPVRISIELCKLCRKTTIKILFL